MIILGKIRRLDDNGIRTLQDRLVINVQPYIILPIGKFLEFSLDEGNTSTQKIRDLHRQDLRRRTRYYKLS